MMHKKLDGAKAFFVVTCVVMVMLGGGIVHAAESLTADDHFRAGMNYMKKRQWVLVE